MLLSNSSVWAAGLGCFSNARGSRAHAVFHNMVAKQIGLMRKNVKVVVEGVMGVAAKELRKNGSFQQPGLLNLELK